MSGILKNGRDEDGTCIECKATEAQYHSRTCSHFSGYHCHKCGRNYYSDYCTACPPPFWVTELAGGER